MEGIFLTKNDELVWNTAEVNVGRVERNYLWAHKGTARQWGPSGGGQQAKVAGSVYGQLVVGNHAPWFQEARGMRGEELPDELRVLEGSSGHMLRGVYARSVCVCCAPPRSVSGGQHVDWTFVV